MYKTNKGSSTEGTTEKNASSSVPTTNFCLGPHAVHTVLLCRLDLGRRHTLYGNRSQALSPSKELAAQIPPECHTGMVSYGGGQSTAGAFYIVRKEHAHRIVPECYLLSQESPHVWPGKNLNENGNTGNSKKGKNSLDGLKIEKVLSELTMPASSSVVGKEAKKITTEFERKVLKEIQRYEHRIFQEMDPETAEQLQQSENEVSITKNYKNSNKKEFFSSNV